MKSQKNEFDEAPPMFATETRCWQCKKDTPGDKYCHFCMRDKEEADNWWRENNPFRRIEDAEES